jgi:hypothetical protein
MNTRKAITIFDEDTAMTLIKPLSGEYRNTQLFVIYEDAYGEAIGILTPIEEVKRKFNGTEEEFQEILNQL